MTPLLVAIPVLVLILLSVGLVVYWTVALARIAESLRKLPTARAGIELARRSAPTGRVCVVVPAHNEANSIGALVESFKAQDHPGASFVLALDRCTDDTERLAREAAGDDDRFEIITIDHCPDDWAGKVHAVWSGVQRSARARAAAHLLFTDADCRLAPECLSATVALLEDWDLDMLSLFSTLDCRDWFEKIVQPATSFELARQYPLLGACHPDPDKRRPFANGQFMLFRRGPYEAIGGHESVKGALLEDIDLSRRMTWHKHATALLLAGGVVRCKMYDSWAQYRKGWKRIYTESANRKAPRLRKNAWRLRGLGAGLPLAGVACLAMTLALVSPADVPLFWAGVVVPALGLAAWFVGMGIVHVGGGSPVWAIPVYPVGAWLTGGIMLEAARDLERGKGTEWGGRTYARAER